MMPVRQVKLLRALETGTFYRVGGNELLTATCACRRHQSRPCSSP